MAIARTAKGTASSKSNGTTLTISGVASTPGSTLIVGIAWEDGGQSDKPALKWGNRDMKYIANSEEVRGDTVVRQYKARVRKNRTKDISATWTNAKNARAMFVSELQEASAKDVQQSNNEVATTSPVTGVAVTSLTADTISIAAFAMLGPTSDAAATAGVGHTIGQRVGTTGGGALSNITLQETYEILSATGNVRSTLSLVTARGYAATIVAYKASQTYTVERSYYQPYDGHPNHETVVFVMKDETGVELFQTHIQRVDFNEMTDDEVTDRITGDCQWWDNKTRDGAPSPDFEPDAAFDSRIATFEDDTVVV